VSWWDLRVVGSPRHSAWSPAWKKSRRARSRSGSGSSTMSPPRIGHRHGLPELCLYPHMTVYDTWRSASSSASSRSRDSAPRPGSGRNPWIQELLAANPAPSPAASASGLPSAGHRAEAAGVLVRRTAVQPRCQASRAMRAELKKLHDRLQATVVYVTHDQVEAMTMATGS